MKIVDNIRGEIQVVISKQSAIRNAEKRIKNYDDPRIQMKICKHTIRIDYKDNIWYYNNKKVLCY